MKKVTILEMPEVLDLLERVGDATEETPLTIRKTHCMYLGDSGDSLCTCYEGQPGVYHVHVTALPGKGIEAASLMEESIVSLFEDHGATLVLGLTKGLRGWKRLLAHVAGERLNYIDLQDDLRMYYFSKEDYNKVRCNQEVKK